MNDFFFLCVHFCVLDFHIWISPFLKYEWVKSWRKKVWRNLKKEKSKASIADENLNVICSSYLSLSAIHVFDAFVVSLWLSPLLFDLNFQLFSCYWRKQCFQWVSQSSWDPINHLGQIKFVSCTRLQTVWTSRLFAVDLKVFWQTCWFGVFLCKFAQSDKGGLFFHLCFYVRFYFLWLLPLWGFTYVYVQKHHALKIQIVFLKIR